MGWLRLVGSLKSLVSFAKEPYKRDYILQKRLIILRSLPIMATPHLKHVPLPPHTCMTTFSFSLCVAYHTCIVTCNVGHVALAHSLRTLATLVAHLLLSSHTCYSRRTLATLFAHLLLSSHTCYSLRTPATLFAHLLLSSHTCHSLRTLATLLVFRRRIYVYHLIYVRLSFHTCTSRIPLISHMYVCLISHMYVYHLTHVHACVSSHICTSRIPSHICMSISSQMMCLSRPIDIDIHVCMSHLI